MFAALNEPEEKDKLLRSLGPVSKVLLLSNHGALCCGETIEEAFYHVNHMVQACEAQLKLLPVGLENLILIPEETRKAIYDAARKPSGEAQEPAPVQNADNKEVHRPQVCSRRRKEDNVQRLGVYHRDPYFNKKIRFVNGAFLKFLYEGSQVARWWFGVRSSYADARQCRIPHRLHFPQSAHQGRHSKTAQRHRSTASRVISRLSDRRGRIP